METKIKNHYIKVRIPCQWKKFVEQVTYVTF